MVWSNMETMKWVPKDQTGKKSREVRIQAEGRTWAGTGGTTSWSKQRTAGGNNSSTKWEAKSDRGGREELDYGDLWKTS